MILIEAMHQQRHPREASRILRDLQHKFQEISLPDLGYLLKNIAKSLRSGCLFAALLMGRRKSHQSSIISKSRMSLVESILSKSQGGMRKWQAPIHGLEWKLLHVDPTRKKRSQAWGRMVPNIFQSLWIMSKYQLADSFHLPVKNRLGFHRGNAQKPRMWRGPGRRSPSCPKLSVWNMWTTHKPRGRVVNLPGTNGDFRQINGCFWFP